MNETGRHRPKVMMSTTEYIVKVHEEDGADSTEATTEAISTEPGDFSVGEMRIRVAA